VLFAHHLLLSGLWTAVMETAVQASFVPEHAHSALRTTSSSSMPYSKHRSSNCSSEYLLPNFLNSKSLFTPTVGIEAAAVLCKLAAGPADVQHSCHCLAGNAQGQEAADLRPATPQATKATSLLQAKLIHCWTPSYAWLELGESASCMDNTCT
jgi:hypothetical protein